MNTVQPHFEHRYQEHGRAIAKTITQQNSKSFFQHRYQEHGRAIAKTITQQNSKSFFQHRYQEHGRAIAEDNNAAKLKVIFPAPLTAIMDKKKTKQEDVFV
jgi:hypothetical protein